YLGCPYLDGEAIPTTKRPGAYGKLWPYADESDLDRVQKAMSARVLVPTFPGLIYIGHAAANRGVSVRTLRRKLKKSKPAITIEKKLCRGKDGNARRRSFLRQAGGDGASLAATGAAGAEAMSGAASQAAPG